MLQRGKVQILPLFLAVLVPFSVAVRKGHVTSDVPSTTATHVMSKISLLLRERSLQSQSKRRTMHEIHLSTQRAIDRETPGAQQSLSDSLQTVIDEIKINIDEKIKRDHDNTQDRINNKVDGVNEMTEKTSDKFEWSNKRDDEWLECVTEEKTRLEAFEQAQVDLETAQGAEQEARGHKQDATPFAKPIPAPLLSLRCFPDQDAECASSLQALRAAREQYDRDLGSELSEARKTYKQAEQALEAAENVVSRRERQVTNRENRWKNQQNQCANKERKRVRSMCAFGRRFQSKCRRIDNYYNLMGRVDRDRGVHSHSLRVEQWTASHVTQCLLNKVISDFQIDSQTLSDCEATVNFDSDVGILARRGDEVEQAATSAAYRCEDAHVKFVGWNWEVPRDVDNIRSDQYVRVDDWQPSFTVNHELPAFDFCDSD